MKLFLNSQDVSDGLYGYEIIQNPYEALEMRLTYHIDEVHIEKKSGDTLTIKN